MTSNELLFCLFVSIFNFYSMEAKKTSYQIHGIYKQHPSYSTVSARLHLQQTHIMFILR